MTSNVTAESIAPANMAQIIQLSKTKPAGDDFTFEIDDDIDQETIARVFKPFHEEVINATGKNIFTLISEELKRQGK